MRLLCIFVCRPELYWITTRKFARYLIAFVEPASSQRAGMAQRFGLRIVKLLVVSRTERFAEFSVVLA